MHDRALLAARIIVVDDDAVTTHLFERILKGAGYADVYCTTDPHEVVDRCTDSHPDLIILDLHMPGLDGFALLERIHEHVLVDGYLPVLVVSGDLSPQARQRALSTGAKDFLAKPFDQHEALLRIRNLLETRHMHLQLRRQNERLEEAVQARTRELEEARIETLDRLARAAEYRDDGTRHHTERVGVYSAELASVLGLGEPDVQLIRRAAPLHDLGKIGIPDRILLKPGELTAGETAIMRTHTTIGAEILSGSRVPTLRLAAEIALCHHERWDGAGYPREIAGDAIPLAARIVSVADFFDALANDRPYRRAWPVAEIFKELRRQRGRRFDPVVLEAFLHMIEREPSFAAVV